jgi:glycosyltransferase involved in cell wall biosynthesis
LPYEIIVINDGSTDGSEQIVSDIKNPLIRLINQVNQGVSSARNRGIQESGGDWIAFLDGDDQWQPGFLKTIFSLNEKFDYCSLIATSYFIQDLSGKRNNILLNRLPFKTEEGVLTNFFEVSSYSNPPICSSAVVIKKELLLSVGGFPENIFSGEDLLTWARIACRTDIAYSIIPQAVYILNTPGNFDRRGAGPPTEDLVANALIDLKKTCQNHSVKHIKQFIARWHKNRASIYLRLTNNRTYALKEIFKSIYYYPLNLKLYLYSIIILLPGGLIRRIFRL